LVEERGGMGPRGTDCSVVKMSETIVEFLTVDPSCPAYEIAFE
jgi:hypothetical protein